MKQTTTRKAISIGTNTIGVSIPRNMILIQDIEIGDYIEITIEKIENQTTKMIKEEKNKQQESKKLTIQE